MLGDRYHIVGVASSGGELMELLPQAAADCVLLDLSLPDVHGLELLPRIGAIHPPVPVLVLSIFNDRVIAEACLGAGARGFIPKAANAMELVRAISDVIGGRQFISPLVPKSTHSVGLHACHLAAARLTPRQQQILQYMGTGENLTQIAATLGLSKSTVSFHEKRIMRTLGFKSPSALRRFAVLVGANAVASSSELRNPYLIGAFSPAPNGTLEQC